jgi:hypothetical protein
MPAGTVYDESTRVYWSEADLADNTAPTTGEIAAAIDLSGYAIPDGVAFNFGNSRVSGADLLTAFDNDSMGRFQATPSITFKRKLRNGEEVAWDTLGDRKLQGTLIVFLTLDPGSDPTTGDACVVFPECETGAALVQNTAVNTEVRFQVDFAVGQQPELRAVVGGS